jgi:hypothetical protein
MKAGHLVKLWLAIRRVLCWPASIRASRRRGAIPISGGRMRRHIQILRTLAATQIVFSLMMAALYWSRSPVYLLGFRHPAIWLWVSVMFQLAAIFLVVLVLLRKRGSVSKIHRVFLGAVLLFSVLNVLPALFYANMRFASERIVLHLVPTVLLLLLSILAVRSANWIRSC